MNVRRVVLGFVLAPIAPSFVIVPLLAIGTGAGWEILPAMGGWTFLAAFYTVPATLLVGVPLFQIFRWRGWTSWKQFALGGALAGALVVVVTPSLFFLVCGIISGAVAALTLWVCAYGDRRSVVISAAALGLLAVLVLVASLLASPIEV